MGRAGWPRRGLGAAPAPPFIPVLSAPSPEGFQADFCCSFQPDAAACEPPCGRTSSSLPPPKAASRDRAKAGGAQPARPDPLPAVPNHVAVSAEGNVSKKTECLGRALPGDRAGQPRAAEGKAGRRDPAPGSEGAPGPEGPRRTAARPDPGPGPESKLPSILGDSRLELTCSNSFPDKPRRNSPPGDALHTDSMKGSGEPQPDRQLTRSLETTFRNLLELKKAGRPAPSDPASQDGGLEKFAPDPSQGAVETDSVLEAAVNSILEC